MFTAVEKNDRHPISVLRAQFRALSRGGVDIDDFDREPEFSLESGEHIVRLPAQPALGARQECHVVVGWFHDEHCASYGR